MAPRLQARLEAEGIPCELHLTRAPGHGVELASALADEGVSRVLAAGGDGTIHEVANGLLLGRGTPPPPLAILPVGTGNDFHRMLRADEGLDAIVAVLKEGVIRNFEVGHVRWHDGEACFVNLLGVGIDVAVLQRRSAFSRLPGLTQYLAALASALMTFRALPLRIAIGGVGGRPALETRADTLLAAITVGPSVGGGFLLSPDALPDDGLLDFFQAEKMSVLEVCRYLPGVVRGTLKENERIRRAKVISARIESPDGSDLSFELDGEVMPFTSPFLEITVNPSPLHILDLPVGLA